MVEERATPGPDPDVVVRYPEHRVAGQAFDMGLCPASLMPFPLGPEHVDHLVAAADELERALNERAARAAAEDQAPRTPKRPRTGDSQWFRWNGGGGGAHTGPYDGYVAPPVMEQVLMPIDDDEKEGFR